MLTLLVLLLLIGGLVVWLIQVYNQLVALKAQYENGFAQIEVQLRRRYDLIPNLVETVKGYLRHENTTLTTVIEARNMADTLSYTTEKAMKDAGDKLTAEEKKPVEEAIAQLANVKNGDDLEAIKKHTEALSQAAQKIGEKLYKAAQEAQAAQQPAAGATGEAKPEGAAEGAPKDAEVEEKPEFCVAKPVDCSRRHRRDPSTENCRPGQNAGEV